MTRVFSGIQPTGYPTLGNYIGAIRHWVAGQGEKENFFCVVDLHSLTVTPDPENLRSITLAMLAVMLGAGLDPERCVLFLQSHVSAHAEGAWLLACTTPISWLQKMTQYKDKSAKGESIGSGLLYYPVLMAADILLYDADEVPVGDDQKQHVELARNIAERFNHLYGHTFVVPNPVIPQIARVMGLDDPHAKMSKSEASARGHAIGILDDPKEIEWAFKRATTDSFNEIRFSDEPERAGVNNLLGIYRALSGRSVEETEADFASARGYGDLKTRVAELTIETLEPIRLRALEYLNNPDELHRIMANGAERARAVAMPKLEEMYGKMGIVRGM